MKLQDWRTMPIDGPLARLSIRRIQRGTVLPTNDDRLAAYRDRVPPPAGNSFAWPHLTQRKHANVVRIRRTA